MDWTTAWSIIQNVCISIAVIGAAIVYIAKGIKTIRKPADDVNDKLQRDYNKLNDHDKDLRDVKAALNYLKDSLVLQMENDLVILEHMRTNNSTGKIAERESKTKEFLLKHQQ